MSIFNKEQDFTKADKVSNLLDEQVEIRIDHCKGESWNFILHKSKLDLFKNGLAACFLKLVIMYLLKI